MCNIGETKELNVSAEYRALLDKKPDTSCLTADAIAEMEIARAEMLRREVTAEQREGFARALFFGKPFRAGEQRGDGGRAVEGQGGQGRQGRQEEGRGGEEAAESRDR